ncbi:MAG: hypothetical protein RJA44_2486, partial [Pseudomonadota bacterium]
MTASPDLDADAPIQFVINTAAGSSDVDTRRAAIERALHAQGRRGELHICHPESLVR